MFEKQLVKCTPRCDVCGNLMDGARARIAVTFLDNKGKPCWHYASYEVCADHLNPDGPSIQLCTHLDGINAIFGITASVPIS